MEWRLFSNVSTFGFVYLFVLIWDLYAKTSNKYLVTVSQFIQPTSIYRTPALCWFLSIKVIFPKTCFLQITAQHCFEILVPPCSRKKRKKKDLQNYFSSPLINLLLQLKLFTFYLCFSSSTPTFLSRSSLSHHILLCQALPSLNITFSSTKIFQNNPTKNNFPIQIYCLES